MLYQMFKLTQQSGVMALEAHFDDPIEQPDHVEVPEVPRQSSTRSTS